MIFSPYIPILLFPVPDLPKREVRAGYSGAQVSATASSPPVCSSRCSPRFFLRGIMPAEIVFQFRRYDLYSGQAIEVLEVYTSAWNPNSPKGKQRDEVLCLRPFAGRPSKTIKILLILNDFYIGCQIPSKDSLLSCLSLSVCLSVRFSLSSSRFFFSRGNPDGNHRPRTAINFRQSVHRRSQGSR